MDFGGTGEGPDDAFVWSDFDEVGGGAELIVAEPVGHERVSVGQTLQTGHKLQGDTGEFVGLDLPDGVARGIHFKDTRTAFAIGAGDEGISIGEANDAVGASSSGNFLDDPALGIVFANDALSIMSDKIIAIGQAAGVAHVGVAAILALGEQADFVDDFSGGVDFEQTTGGAFTDESVAVGQALAGVDFAGRFVVEDNFFVAGDFFDAMAGGEEEIAVGENPDVVAVGGAVEFPHDFALVGDDEDLALGVVGANEGMCDWAGGGNCGRIRGSGL